MKIIRIGNNMMINADAVVYARRTAEGVLVSGVWSQELIAGPEADLLWAWLQAQAEPLGVDGPIPASPAARAAEAEAEDNLEDYFGPGAADATQAPGAEQTAAELALAKAKSAYNAAGAKLYGDAWNAPHGRDKSGELVRAYARKRSVVPNQMTAEDYTALTAQMLAAKGKK